MRFSKSNILCIIFVFLTNITFAQEKIKFGYHSPTGKAKTLNTEEIEKNKKEPKLIIPKTQQKTLHNSDVIHSSDSVFTIIKDTITISVLLPFYIDKNDTLLKYLRENEKDTHQIYNKSNLAISFLEGILLSVDTLEKLGIPVVIHVFDTENNIDTLKKIITDNRVKSSNILFGPIYLKNFNLVRNFFRKDYNKVIINPLSKNYTLLKESKNVYFLRPFIKQNKDSLVRCIIKNEKKKKLIIVSNEQESKKSEYFILKNRLLVAFPGIVHKEFRNLSSVNKSSFGFLSDQENIVLILSEDKPFIKKVVTFCGASDSLITIYAQEPLQDVLELNTETLMKLNVHIPVSNYFNRHSSKNRRLLHQFESNFSHQIDDYSLLSFRSILHFCSDKRQFSFIKFSNNGGYINTDVRMCVYKDYNLSPIE